MSELAFNYQGERFILPSEASLWRVRRIRDGQRGQLDVVRDGEGVPLNVPIDISHDEFRASVGDQDGRYRLDALNAEKLPVDGPPAYVTVPAARRSAAPAPRIEPVEAPAPSATVTAPFGTWPALPMPATLTGTEYLLAEALRGQVAMFQTLAVTLADRMASNANGASLMMGAAAELVRAADGAAMPRRRPEPPAGPLAPAPVVVAAPVPEPRNAARYAPDPDDFDDEDDGPEPAAEGPKDEMDGMIEKLGKVMSAVAPAVPHLVALVRGYPPTDAGLRNAPAAEAVEPVGDDEGDEESDEPAPAVTHAMASHMILVHQELGEDGRLFRHVLQRMEPEERRALVAHLCTMTIDDAVDIAATRLAAIKMRLMRRARAQRAERSVPAEAPSAPDAGHPERHAEHDGAGPAPGHQAHPAEGASHDSDDCDPTPNPEPATQDDLDPAPHQDRIPQAPHADADGVTPDDHDLDDHDPDDHDPDDRATRHDAGPTPVPPVKRSPPRASASPTAAMPPAPPTPVAPNLDAHMMKIAGHLTIPEVIQARGMIGSVPAAERATWIARLLALPPAEAAKVVRAELARRAGH